MAYGHLLQRAGKARNQVGLAGTYSLLERSCYFEVAFTGRVNPLGLVLQAAFFLKHQKADNAQASNGESRKPRSIQELRALRNTLGITASTNCSWAAVTRINNNHDIIFIPLSSPRFGLSWFNQQVIDMQVS